MNKGDLIETVAKKTGMTKKDAAEAVNLTLATIQANVKKGVLLVGFGSFKVTRRKARLGRNPQTDRVASLPPQAWPPRAGEILQGHPCSG